MSAFCTLKHNKYAFVMCLRRDNVLHITRWNCWFFTKSFYWDYRVRSELIFYSHDLSERNLELCGKFDNQGKRSVHYFLKTNQNYLFAFVKKYTGHPNEKSLQLHTSLLAIVYFHDNSHFCCLFRTHYWFVGCLKCFSWF